VGYNRPFSSAVLNAYCRSLKLTAVTAEHLRQYFTDLRASLQQPADTAAADVAAVVAEYEACQPGDPLSIDILRNGVQDLALHLAGLD
jgi:hypothetical protein